MLGLYVINLFDQLLQIVHDLILQHLAVGRNLLESSSSFDENLKHEGVCILPLLPLTCKFIKACNLLVNNAFVITVELTLFSEIKLRVNNNFNLSQAGNFDGVDVVLSPEACKYGET